MSHPRSNATAKFNNIRRLSSQRERGFTMIEVVLATFLATVGSGYVASSKLQQVSDERGNKTAAEIMTIERAAQNYVSDEGDWPDAGNNCAGALTVLHNGGYLPASAIDINTPIGGTYGFDCTNPERFQVTLTAPSEDVARYLANNLPAASVVGSDVASNSLEPGQLGGLNPDTLLFRTDTGDITDNTMETDILMGTNAIRWDANDLVLDNNEVTLNRVDSRVRVGTTTQGVETIASNAGTPQTIYRNASAPSGQRNWAVGADAGQFVVTQNSDDDTTTVTRLSVAPSIMTFHAEGGSAFAFSGQDILFDSKAAVTNRDGVDGTMVLNAGSAFTNGIVAESGLQVTGNVTANQDLFVGGLSGTPDVGIVGDLERQVRLTSTSGTPNKLGFVAYHQGAGTSALVHEQLDANTSSWNFVSDDITQTLHVNGAEVMDTSNGGEGSLFDADFIDGLTSAQFLRSDVDDTLNGRLTITKNQADLLNLSRSGGSNVNIRLNSSGVGTSYLGQGAAPGTLMIGESPDLIALGQRVYADNYHPLADLATTVMQTTNPADGPYRLLLGNGDSEGAMVYNFSDLMFDSTNATLMGANIDGSAEYLDGEDSAFYRNADNINAGTLAEARLPFRMNQNVRTTDNVSFNQVTSTFVGNGAALTNLNASQLTSGTVPAARLSGDYNINNTGTLDGLDSAQFLRSDANDVMTGNLTMDGTSITFTAPNTTGGWARGNLFEMQNGTGIGGVGMYGSGTNSNYVYFGGMSSPWSNYALKTNTGSRRVDFYATPYVGSNKIFHAGNDGAGSLLDADRLDGQEGSFYRNASNINAGTLAEARLPYRMNQNVRSTDAVTFASQTITGSPSNDAALRITNGRLTLGHHNNGSGVWYQDSGNNNEWFAGLNASNGFRFHANGQDRMTLDQQGNLSVTGNITGENFRVAGISRQGTGTVHVLSPGGASYDGTSGATGAIAITLPTAGLNTMLHFTVDLYDYTTNESLTAKISGYLRTNGNWLAATATIISPTVSKELPVRFANSGSNAIVYIGNTDSTWSYPKVHVRDFVAGHSGSTANVWEDGWSVGLATAFEPVSITLNDTLVAANDSQKLNGELAAFYQNASNMNAGTLPSGRLSGNYNINNQGTLDGLNSTQFIRADADDTFSGKLVSTARDGGVYGTYSSSKTDHIWSMGTAYRNSATGDDFGNLYGMAYKHTNNPTGGAMAGGHQVVFTNNGNPGTAIGMGGNVWTKGSFISTTTSAAPLTVASTIKVDNLNADLLDGQTGAFYQNASNLNAGTLPAARLSGNYNINNTGTLDGLNAAQFLRADTNDVATGKLTFNGELDINDWTYFNAAGQNFVFETDNQNRSTLEWQQNGTRKWTLDAAANGDLNFLPTGSQKLRVDGGLVWTSTNDGAGSLLDADKLDGQQGSFYRNASNINAGTLAETRLPYRMNQNVRTSDNVTFGQVNVSGLLRSYGAPVLTADGNYVVKDTRSDDTPTDMGTSGVRYEFKANATDGLSDGGAYHGIMTFQPWTDSSGGDTYQLGFTENGNLWMRHSDIGGTWQSWNKLYAQNSDGSGSGLDADLLDGQQGSYYRNASNINAGTLAEARLPYRMNQNVRSTDSVTFAEVNATFNGNGAGITGLNASNLASGTVPAARLSGNYNINNTGTLDGYSASIGNIGNRIAVRDASGDINARLFRSEYDVTNGSIGYIMTQVDTASNNYIRPSTPTQVVNALPAGALRDRIKTVDGSGSGLDADLLDGQQGSYYRNASNINAGTLAEARLPYRMNQNVRSTDTVTFAEGRFTDGIAAGGANLHVLSPGGAALSLSNTQTGAIRIKLPVLGTNTMMRMTVDVFDYNQNDSFTVKLGGYNYSGANGLWTRTFADVISGNPNNDYSVRFGHDGANGIIWIGETDTAWSYPKVRVRDFVAGHSGATYDNWADGWGITIATEFDTVKQTLSDNLVAASSLDGLDSTQFLRSDVSDTMTGKLTIDHDGVSNQGTLELSNSAFTGSSNTGPHIFGKAGGSALWWLGSYDAASYGNDFILNATNGIRLRAGGQERVNIGNANANFNVGIDINNGAANKIDFNDTTSYLLATANNWGLHWDTSANEMSYRGAGAVKWKVDLDNGATWQTGIQQIAADATDVINLSANSTNDNRGISFNGRTALSADYNDGWLRLNNVSEFTNGTLARGTLRLASSGKLELTDANTYLEKGAGNSVRARTNYGYVEVGPQNTSWAHFLTDRPAYYFNKKAAFGGNANTYLASTEGRINNNVIWHAGNDGTGSGLDADTVDGYEVTSLYRTTSTASATVGPGWVTVAETTSGRSHGEVFVTDGDSGDHSFIRIDWMRSFNDSPFTVMNVGGHANRITGVRVLKDGDATYGNRRLQVYVTASSNYKVGIKTPGSTEAFGLLSAVTPVVENSIDGYSLYGVEMTGLDQYTLATSEGIRAGGNFYTTGNYYSNGNVLFHTGNDGSGSLLDADRLDGQEGSFYRNASNINAGVLPSARLSGAYNINNTGTFNGQSAAFYRNASNMNAGTLAEARLPYRMNQNVRTTDNVTFAQVTATLVGNGAGITSLNASNLASGTVPAARLSGNYNINNTGTLDGLNASQFLRSDVENASGRFESLTVDNQIISNGDTNTYMQFHAGDQWRVVTGGAERFEINNSNATFATHVKLNDNINLRLGTGNDYRLWHNGTDAYMRSYLHGSRLLIQGENASGSNRSLVIADPDNSVDLYYAGALVAQTTATGLSATTFTGNATSATNAANADKLGNQTSAFYRNASNINAGTLAEARLPFRMNQHVRTTDSVTFHEGAFADGLSVGGSNLHVVSPGGGSLSASGNQTGAIKIKLPQLWTNTMMRFMVDVFDYTTNESFTVAVAGYNYTGTGNGGYWVNTTADIISGNANRDFAVRFGHDGSKAAVWIGETNSTWSYLKVRVRDYVGNSTASAWADGWAVTVENSLGTVQATQTGNLLAAATAKIADNALKLDGQNAAFYRNASNINAGTLAEARLPYRMNQNVRTSDQVTFAKVTATFAGNGAAITNLNASNLATGTVPAARLSGNYNINNTGTLDGHEWASPGKNVRATEFYADNWFRNYNTDEGLMNVANGNHFYSDTANYWALTYAGANGGLMIRDGHNGAIRGRIYATDSNEIGFLDSDGNWAIKVVRDSRVDFFDNNERTFSAGQGGVTGSFGTVQTHGNGKAGWEGYNINGNTVFMANGTNSGIYNDTDNEWFLQSARNSYTALYFNGGKKIETTADGINVLGKVNLNGVDIRKQTAVLHDVANGTSIPKPTCTGGASPEIYTAVSKVTANGIIETISGIETYAVDNGDGTWAVYMRTNVLGVWSEVTEADEGRIIATTQCSV